MVQRRATRRTPFQHRHRVGVLEESWSRICSASTESKARNLPLLFCGPRLIFANSFFAIGRRKNDLYPGGNHQYIVTTALGSNWRSHTRTTVWTCSIDNGVTIVKNQRPSSPVLEGRIAILTQSYSF